MNITLKDGSVKAYDQPMAVIDIAKDLSEGLARIACAGEVDGEVVDLRTVVDHDAQVNILTANDEGGLSTLRNSQPCNGTGNQTSVSEYKAGNRTVHRRWILLRCRSGNFSDSRRHGKNRSRDEKDCKRRTSD